MKLPDRIFDPVDRHLAALLERLASKAGAPREHAAAVGLAGALASLRAREGHGCVQLDEEGGTTLAAVAEPGVENVALTLPESKSWLDALRSVPDVVGIGSEPRPLVLEPGGRLYLHRFHQAESDIALALTALAGRVDAAGVAPEFDLPAALDRYFPPDSSGETDWQKVAAFAALQGRLTVICGGPGTGKTHTVVFLLALLLEQAAPRRLRIEVCAPTGKAAARLQESMAGTIARLPCTPEIRDALPKTVRTVHRVLGASAIDGTFRHGPEAPIDADVVVVDEASMADLALVARLLGALRKDARLILVGDPGQLPSVDAGGVLADICQPDAVRLFPPAFAAAWLAASGKPLPPEIISEAAPPLAQAIVGLHRNRRFGDRSDIHAVASAVRDGNFTKALTILESDPAGSARLSGLPPTAMLKAALRTAVLDGWQGVFDAEDPAAKFKAMGDFRILCAVRDGPYGVTEINRLVVEILREAGRVRGSEWFDGRQIMITANDYALGLSNGDLGLVTDGPEGLEVRFQPDDVRHFAPARLPAHETAFALTIHKSQGSEFRRVLIILPAPHPGAEAVFQAGQGRILARELVYTGLTRASAQVEIWAAPEVLEQAVTRSLARASGLATRLHPGLHQNRP
jgi:exodeoxyribonuclease V alpha subunit